MIIDPSRVLLLGEYATLAESGSETELGAREAEVRVFLEALWSAAGAAGRRRFMEAVGAHASKMPWVAVGARGPDEDAESLAPPAAELLLDTTPMGDEGVAAHHLDAESEAAQRCLEAIRAWDWDLLDQVLTPSGWRLEDLDAVFAEVPAEVGDPDTKDDSDSGSGSDPEPAPENAGEEGEEDSGGALVFPESVTVTRTWWPWALAAGGIGVVGTALWLAAGRKEEKEKEVE